MPLKTSSGRTIDACKIECVLRGRMVVAVKETLVQLQSGEEVLFENSDEEVVEEMNIATVLVFKESVEY